MTKTLIEKIRAEMPHWKSFIEKAQKSQEKIMILTHANPDGDAIGSALGLYLAFQQLGLNVSVGCKDHVPKAFSYLSGTENFVQTFDPYEYSSFFFVDCGDKKLTRLHEDFPRILSDDVFKGNIDHHPTNDNFGELNLVITEASSACEILAFLFQELGVRLDPFISSALLLGIYTDTGGFMHQNTTPDSYLSAADLVENGGSISQIAQNVFCSHDFRKLKLWGKVIQNLHITDEGVAIVGVKKHEYEDLGTTRNDLAGVVDLINSMPEVQYSVILSEDEKGNVKGSLRTRKENMDVRAIAEKFGGGGHVKASGFTIPNGKLKKEVKWKIVTE